MAAITATRQERNNGQLINPFYSPSFADDGNEQYEYAQYKVRAILGALYLLTPIQPTFPDISWEPLKEVKVTDRGLYANSEKKNLLSAASKVITLTPTIGTELHGIDLHQLSDTQKDELCVFLYHQARHTKRLRVYRSLLAAERGVVCK
jgi:sulfonate dioxygenase